MEKLKNISLTITGVAFIAGCFYLFLQQPAPEQFQKQTLLKIGDKTIVIEVADTDAERTQGLSGRESLEENRGLLFVFEVPGFYGFWMKEMRFPIDIVFLDASFKVINVYRGVEPSTFPTPFYPLAPAQYVLEIRSGQSVKLGIDTGSQMSLIR